MPTFLLAEVVTRAECYMKGENNNVEKNMRVKECVSSTEGLHHPRKRSYTSFIEDNVAFKRLGKMVDNFTLLNTCRE